MTNVEIEARDGWLRVRGPRDRRLAVFAAVLGAQREGDAWLFEAKHERAIREFCRKMSGLDAAPQPSPPTRVVENATAGLASSIVALLDPAIPVWQQMRHAQDAAALLDVNHADRGTLEEVAAGFESLAARLRELSERRDVQSSGSA